MTSYTISLGNQARSSRASSDSVVSCVTPMINLGKAAAPLAISPSSLVSPLSSPMLSASHLSLFLSFFVPSPRPLPVSLDQDLIITGPNPPPAPTPRRSLAFLGTVDGAPSNRRHMRSTVSWQTCDMCNTRHLRARLVHLRPVHCALGMEKIEGSHPRGQYPSWTLSIVLHLQHRHVTSHTWDPFDCALPVLLSSSAPHGYIFFCACSFMSERAIVPCKLHAKNVTQVTSNTLTKKRTLQSLPPVWIEC